MTALSGPTSNTAYAAMIVEVTGGTYLAPTARFPISDATVNIGGGTMGIDPLAGSRDANLATISTELTVSVDVNGPYTEGNPILAAAVLAHAGEIASYSLEVNTGIANSHHAAGAILDKFSIKGAVNSRVDYSASFKAQSIATATAGSPSAAAITPFGLKDVAITGPALAAGATAFEVNIDEGAKTQAVYGAVAPLYLFATTFLVTGKVTMVSTAAGDTATVAAGTSLNIVIVLSHGGTAAKTLTMGACYVTKVGVAVKVGNLTMQDVEFIAAVSGGTAALVVT